MSLRLISLFIMLIAVSPIKGALHADKKAPFDIEELDKLRLLIIADQNMLLGDNNVFGRYVALKRLFGFDVECVYVNNTTSPEVIRDSIDNWKNYVGDNCTKFVLLFGDIKSFTSKSIYNNQKDFYTDLYYFTDLCKGCKFAEIKNVCYGGRIYSSTLDGGAASALVQLAKIIEYETDPPDDAGFYKSAVHCSMFDDREKPIGYEDMRMIQTSEDILTMARANDINVSRYYTTNRYLPRYRYSSTFGAGALIDNSIRFATEDSAYDDSIRSAIDKGALYVLYNGHGDESYWCSPSFDSWTNLQNGIRYPIVFNLSCLTGVFGMGQPTGFSIALMQMISNDWLRSDSIPYGGAVGVIGATDQYSLGYSDAFGLGLFDAIWWSNEVHGPTGIGNKDPILYPDITPTYRLGQIINYAKNRLIDWFRLEITNPSEDNVSYKSVRHGCEVFHLYGDPTMRMYTKKPGKFAKPTVGYADSTYTVEYYATDTVRITVSNDDVAYKLSTEKGKGVISLTYRLKKGEDWRKLRLCISAPDMRPLIMNMPVPAKPVASIQRVRSNNGLSESAYKLLIGSSVDPSKPTGAVTVTGGEIELYCDTLIIAPATTFDYGVKTNINFISE